MKASQSPRSAGEAPTISVVMAILGDYKTLWPLARQLVDGIASSPAAISQFEFILVVQDDFWKHATVLSHLPPNAATIVSIGSIAELPAALFNHGARLATGRFLSFAKLGVEYRDWIAALDVLEADCIQHPDAVMIAGRPNRTSVQRTQWESWLREASATDLTAYQSGWLEMLDYLPMEGTAVARDHFIRQGGFSCSPILQWGFWWEFALRVARKEPITASATLCESLWSWHEYPFREPVAVSGDLVARRVVRRDQPRELLAECDWHDVEKFAGDLPSADRTRLRRRLMSWDREVKHGSLSETIRKDHLHASRALKVTVLGGVNEPAHNQLCFFNYFARLENEGILSWRVVLDNRAHLTDLMQSDIVIFSRVKSENGCRMMDYCNRHGIPTIYMLDDNWFSISDEWPEYKGLFVPGSTLYELFIYCLERADCALTYNELLAEDMRGHCKRIEVLPTNIDLSLFRRARRNRERPLVGYVGSYRSETSAFDALASLVSERDDFDVFVMSGSLPKSLQDVPRHRVEFNPYVFSYERYAQIISEVAPDVLLAPAGSTRTDASKCPNKYLEISACGAAGIYSDNLPFNRHVVDGRNGLLVENDLAAWRQGIIRLLEDRELRRRIGSAAAMDVEKHFSTDIVLPRMVRLLTEVSNYHG